MVGSALLRALLQLRGGVGSERLAMAAAGAAGRLAGLSQARQDDLRTAVAEACLNAFEHGNRGDPALPVRLVFTARPGTLRVEVRDRGTGFDPAAQRSPELGRLLVEGGGARGWGLFLMGQLADRLLVRQGRGGCSVVLEFHQKEG